MRTQKLFHAPQRARGLVSHLLSDAGEKMSEHPEGNASGKVEQLEAIRAFFPPFPCLEVLGRNFRRHL